MRQGNLYGLHRVLEPVGSMPQSAWKIDNDPTCYDNEMCIDVETLNIDSASFTQIKQEAGDDPQQVAAIMQRIVAERGKHHNPVTGSGGMLIGRVSAIGPKFPADGVQVGDRVATLVSLSLTPLTIDAIEEIDMKNAQVKVKGKAILFESGIFARMPDDLPYPVALAAFDVCGAPLQTARMVKPESDVVIFGSGGKSGLMVLRQARLSSPTGRIVAVEYGEVNCERIRDLGYADVVLNLDATAPATAFLAVQEALSGDLADVVINCVNVPNTEMACILCAKDEGVVYFFSMATSFTAAALGAEGVGKDVQMVIGNGYGKGHAEHTLQLLRESPELLRVFQDKFAK